MVFTRWKLIITSLSITIHEVVLRDTFLSKIRAQKKLQAGVVEFDRMRKDDDQRELQRLTQNNDRRLARYRMEWARKLQRKSFTSGATDVDSTPGEEVMILIDL